VWRSMILTKLLDPRRKAFVERRRSRAKQEIAWRVLTQQPCLRETAKYGGHFLANRRIGSAAVYLRSQASPGRLEEQRRYGYLAAGFCRTYASRAANWGLALLMRPTRPLSACRSHFAAMLEPERMRQQSSRHSDPVDSCYLRSRLQAQMKAASRCLSRGGSAEQGRG